LKAKLFFDGNKPKVGGGELKRVVEKAGLQVVTARADLGIVVGGDGIFSMYGRMESIPLLFVGVRSRTGTGSKAYLAAAYFDELPEALHEIAAGRFTVKEHKRLKVLKNGTFMGDIFTDVYLQRGADSNCIRYRLKVEASGLRIDESAIGDGVVVSTSAGATGYYSYPDKIRGDLFEVTGHAVITEDEIGICHIVPTFTERRGTGGYPLRYTVPWGSRIELSITRPADARLYGVHPGRGGVRVKQGERVAILASQDSTKVILLDR
jgi:hypothetical protein